MRHEIGVNEPSHEFVRQSTATLPSSPITDVGVTKKSHLLKIFSVGLVAVGLLTLAYIILNYQSEHVQKSVMPSTPTPQEPVVINTYPLLSFDEIEVDVSILQYPNSRLLTKLRGKNNKNQDVTYFGFSIPKEVQLDSITEFFQTKLPESGWVIHESDEKRCLDPKQVLCIEWRTITARKSNQWLEFSVSDEAGVRYATIELFEGEETQAILQLPANFPQEAIPPGVEIQKILVVLDTNGFLDYTLVVENLSANAHLGTIEAAGWMENCGLISAIGAVNYGCSKGESYVSVSRRSGENYPKEQTRVYVRFPYLDPAQTIGD
jgi:hypothetical protein